MFCLEDLNMADFDMFEFHLDADLVFKNRLLRKPALRDSGLPLATGKLWSICRFYIVDFSPDWSERREAYLNHHQMTCTEYYGGDNRNLWLATYNVDVSRRHAYISHKNHLLIGDDWPSNFPRTIVRDYDLFLKEFYTAVKGEIKSEQINQQFGE